MATKKLRTECFFFQPVAFMIAAMVVPLGCRSRARTVACLVLRRRKAGLTFLRFAVFGCAVGAMFVRMLLCDMVRSSRLRRHMRRHRRNPTVATSPAGRDPRAQEVTTRLRINLISGVGQNTSM